tara:strand:+ start:3109 stop:3351 length:243 start_codon:yes stop_codon:yes gene_type:complete
MNAETKVFEIPEMRRYILSYYLEKSIPPPKIKLKEKIKLKLKSCGKSLKRHGECLCCCLNITGCCFFIIIRHFNIRFPGN